MSRIVERLLYGKVCGEIYNRETRVKEVKDGHTRKKFLDYLNLPPINNAEPGYIKETLIPYLDNPEVPSIEEQVRILTPNLKQCRYGEKRIGALVQAIDCNIEMISASNSIPLRNDLAYTIYTFIKEQNDPLISYRIRSKQK
ncbi:MAG: hypothetical protein U9O94_08605 [Nanoarchaeota archaeon]|nr:hypothetical protein [Nanoarchaeota archaeon]